MKFIHAADIHLDSPLRGLERYPGAPAESIRGATRQALDNLVQLCLDEQADLLLIAGDLYDGDWKDYNTGLFFVARMARLTRAGVRVVMIRGNHDAASQLTKNLRLPEGVHDLSVRKAQTVEFDDIGVAVHGRGYPRRDMTDNLVTAYPEPRADCFNIGLLHTAVDGREGHDSYAPCSVNELINKGYQYWALGHVHRREVLCEDPWIVFPGNLQGRHAREIGAKGATLVTVDGGAVSALEHRPLDVLRWSLCEVDIASAATGFDVLERVRETLAARLEDNDGRMLAARLKLVGMSRAHNELAAAPEDWKNQIRAAAADLDGEVWVEKIELATRTSIDLETLLTRDDPAAGLLRSLRGLRTDPAGLEALLGEFADLKRLLPAEYLQFDDALDLDRPASLYALLGEVEQLLIPRLLDDAS